DDPVVAAVADKQPSARIHCQRVRAIQLTIAGSFRPPRLDQLSALREFQDTRVGAAMAFGDEDVSVRRDEHVVRLVEESRRRGAAARAERHQERAVWTELENLVPLRGARRWTEER